MIKANFSAYSTYMVDSLHQWDIDQTLQVSGLNLTSAPEVHFSNANVERAIVRQSEMVNHVVSVKIPNSLLQDALRIYAHIGVYEGKTFKVVEVVEIPVQPRKRPMDYKLEDTDEEVYSFKQLENALADKATKAQVANIVANVGSTAELVDARYGADGKTYPSVGEAVREQFAKQSDLYSTYHSKVELLVGSLAGAANKKRLHAVMTPGVSHFYVHAPDGYVYGVQGYSADDYATRTYDSGWKQGANQFHGMDSALYYNIEFRKADDSNVPAPTESGIVVLQSVSLTDIVDNLVADSALRCGPYYDATRDFVRSIAHRGYSSEAPENTAPAFILAKQKGFQYAEVDIQVTADGKYVCVHDGTCTKYTNGVLTGNVSEYKLAALQAQDWGAWKGEKWAGTKIMTFEEVVLLCKKLSMHLYIELKYTHTAEDVAYYVDYVRKTGMLRNVSWIAGSYNTDVRAADPKARIGVTASTVPEDTLVDTLTDRFLTADGDFFWDLEHSIITPELVEKLTSAGATVEAYTVNDMETMESLLPLNVSGVTTDALIVGEELQGQYI